MSVSALQETIRRMASNSACGPDGWRAGELKALPEAMLERLVVMLTVVESSGRWPEALATGFISLIPKGEGAAPEKLRPISVMSVVYRAWAATRLRELVAWQEQWIPDELHGFRPVHSAEDVWWPLALKVERALLEGSGLCGVSLDYSKCFDRIPMDIVLKLAAHVGMASAIVRAVRAMYAQLWRRFRFAGNLGTPFQATNGILQGCPLSIVLLNLLVCVWARGAHVEAPGAVPHGYADDTGAIAVGPDGCAKLQRLLDFIGAFASVTGQQLNDGKSKCWSTGASLKLELAQLRLAGVPLDVVTGMRCLGAHLSFERHALRNEVGERACCQARAIVERIRWAPLALAERAILVGSVANSKALYSFPAGGLNAVTMNSYRTACLGAVWGASRKLKSPEAVWTSIVKGHFVDPRQRAAYACLRMLRRMLLRFVDLRADVAAVLRIYDQGARSAPGPIGVLLRQCKLMSWDWKLPGFFVRPHAPPLPLLLGPSAWWDHQVREGMRLAE